MRVSFDFDATLSEETIQRLCGILVKAGAEVFVITARSGLPVVNQDLYTVTELLGIKAENIHFTEGTLKLHKVKELQIDIHFDDMEDEVHAINKNGGFALLVGLDIAMLKYLFEAHQEKKLDT